MGRGVGEEGEGRREEGGILVMVRLGKATAAIRVLHHTVWDGVWCLLDVEN